ncbi:TonB-dependent receptor [Algimonas porphyrae]|uniref:TonB-dependent receptor n=1 Tax=Algimonas porphyrae TaxID=1128113 RepID=A0ABQ5V1L6_9PROT|nr:TonB-dependent receptor [Algimonas porphyrae]GLQ20579.1 TonB-dependent receptor [Algimonas porphyrae]
MLNFHAARASTLALLTALAAGQTALAQDRTSAIDALTDEIVVTATKKTDAENVQDVPIAVTAFNGGTLEALKVRSLESLTFSAPNVSLDDIGTTRGTANFSIRGLGVNSSIPSIDPTVGVFVDGVYLGLNSGVVFDLFDLDSVEVLRGPQGILFGRNTTGGAVLINTGNPTDEFEYKARVAVESPLDDDRGGINSFIQGTVSGPIIEGRLNGKLGGYFNGDSGYFKNLATGDNHGEAQTYIGRGALEFFASENVTILAKGEYFTSEGDGPSAQNRGLYDRESFDFAVDNEGFYDTTAYTGSIKLDWDVALGDGVITNIFGYRDFSSATDSDIDATSLFLFHSTTELEQDQISNELRYTGTFGRAEVTTGLFYFDQSVAYTEVRDLPPLSPLTFYGGGMQDHTVLGLFGAVDFSVTEQFILNLGLRYSEEDKDAAITYVRPRPMCSVVGGTCPTTGTNPFIPTENNGFTDSDSWSNFSPRLGFQYFPNDNTQFYGSWSRGYRSGGYNFRITAPAAFEAIFPPGSERAFDEEQVDSFELGAKLESDDRRWQLNAAIFETGVQDMQRELNLSDPTAGVLQTIINTADATIRGFEVDGRFRVSDSFLVTANLGVISADYDEVLFDISSDGNVDTADLELALPRVPDATYGFGFIHEADLGNAGALTSRLDFQYRDAFAYTDNNFGWVQAANMLNGNVAWQTPMDGVTLSLYARNLLDEVQVGGDTQLPFGGAVAPLVPGATNRSTGVNVPFGANPAIGTFSPLKKGRLFGLELTIRG